jgi:hypothetical protein
MSNVTIDQAIARGTRVINVPVWVFLLSPEIAWVGGRHTLADLFGDKAFSIAMVVLFVGCFLAAWLWWAVQVPKWRLWAYERVDDIPELKRRAIAAKLIWPDDSIFTRTEIKSESHAARERALEQRAAKHLEFMRISFTIIDTFRVTDAILSEARGLACGAWYVLEGRFEDVSELPSPGAYVTVIAPTSERHLCRVDGVEVRHGTAALMFSMLMPGQIPRLSVVSLATEEL